MKILIAILTLLTLIFFASSSLADDVIKQGTLHISEVMASNKATLEDGFGQYSDWIELENAGSETVDLSTVWLSDKEDKPDKYTFPAGTMLDPGKFILVFASGLKKDILPDERHASFKLSASEENVYLSMDGALIDSIAFTSQMSDISFALGDDGAFSQTITPTPGWANQIVKPEN